MTTTTTSTTASNTTASNTTAGPASLPRRIAAVLAIAFAMLLGFGIAGASASTAHADTIAGDTVFGTEVECGGNSLFFTTTSDEVDGSWAQLWVYDTAIEEWVTDELWVEADSYATFNVADLTFEPGYYMVYVSYAQWNGYDFDYSGEYINTYEQYYSYDDHAASDYCYMGNDLSLDY